MTVRVIVASHKKAEVPTDEIYLPVFVGSFGKEDIGCQRDDAGENISNLNSSFSELTGLYWAWKNIDYDYIGMIHYRRHFLYNKKLLTKEDFDNNFVGISIFLPKKRKYYIETLESHYYHTHKKEHLDITKDIISREYPEYLNAYNVAVNRTWGYMFNMFIMKKDLLNDYCSWLFDILFELYEKVDTQNYSSFEKRYIGRVSELLLNVWLEKQLNDKKISKKEIKELNTDLNENMLVKIPAFIKAKFFKVKYKESFK